MDRVRATALRHIQDFWDIEIGFQCRRPDRVRLIRFQNVQGGPIHIGIYRRGGNAQFAAGADDSDRDLSSIGDEQGPDLHNVV